MPTYDYQCSHCNFKFELRQSFYEDPIVSCPLCQSQAHRLFHPTGIIFKGSGWYATDNRGGGGGGGASKTKDAGSWDSDSYRDVGD